MKYRYTVYWDEQTKNGFAFDKRPYPDPNTPNAGFIDFDGGPAGPELDPEWEHSEFGLAIAAESLGLVVKDATEWNPQEGWAEWIVEAPKR